MYIVVVAWIYVALMMAVAEATNTNGTVLGAIVTFLLYGLAPVVLVVYLMGTPARRRAIKAREAAERAQYATEHAAKNTGAQADTTSGSGKPDAGGEAPAAAQPGTVAPVRKEP